MKYTWKRLMLRFLLLSLPQILQFHHRIEQSMIPLDPTTTNLPHYHQLTTQSPKLPGQPVFSQPYSIPASQPPLLKRSSFPSPSSNLPPTAPPSSPKLINNYLPGHPSSALKSRSPSVDSLLVYSSEDEDQVDSQAQGTRRDVHNQLDIVVAKPKLSRKLVKKGQVTEVIKESMEEEESFKSSETGETAARKLSSFYYNHEINEAAENNQQQNKEQPKENVEELKEIQLNFPLPPVMSGDILRGSVQKGKTMKCIIRRMKQKDNALFVLQDQSSKPILYAKRMDTIMKTYYLSISDTEFDKKSKTFVGKIRSKFFETSFCTYLPFQKDGTLVKSIFVTVEQQSHLFSSQPKRIIVTIPKLKQDGQYEEILTNNDENLRCKKHKTKVHTFYNKQIDENSVEAAASYKGRALVKSTKNLILVTQQTNQQHLLIGKVSSDEFNLDISYPLSVVHAFSVALTRI